MVDQFLLRKTINGSKTHNLTKGIRAIHGSLIKTTEDDKLGELLVNAMKDMAIISYAILECSSDGQYIEVLILTQSSMVYLLKERFLYLEHRSYA